MKNYSRCKVCGFITETEKIGEKCAACGVPKTAFEAYKPNINEKRMNLLNIHAHPIILHFPQAFTVTALFLLLIMPLLGGDLKNLVLNGSKVFLILLAPSVIAGFVTGLFDGKIRFKKVSTPMLKQKIVLGSVYILLSIIASGLAIAKDLAGAVYISEIVLLVISSAIAIILGRMGSSLMDSRMPG